MEKKGGICEFSIDFWILFPTVYSGGTSKCLSFIQKMEGTIMFNPAGNTFVYLRKILLRYRDPFSLLAFSISFFLFLSCSVNAQNSLFPDAKSESIYRQINKKIIDLEKEHKKKINNIESYGYSQSKKEELLNRLAVKYKRRIEDYKAKGNNYFKKRGLPLPWELEQEINERKASSTVKSPQNTSSRVDSTKNTSSTVDSTVSVIQDSSVTNTTNSKMEDSFPGQLTDKFDTEIDKGQQESPQIQHSQAIAHPSNRTTQKTDGFFKAITLTAAAIFFIISALVLTLINIITWKKRKLLQRGLLGCGSLFCLISAVAVVIISIFFFNFKNGSAPVEQTATNSLPGTLSIKTAATAKKQENLDIPKLVNVKITDKELDIIAPEEDGAHEYFIRAVKLARDAASTNDFRVYEKALLLADAAVKMNSDKPQYWMLLGDLYHKLNYNDDAALLAEHALRQCIELDPNNTAAELLLADVLYDRKAYCDALVIYQKLIKTNPEFIDKTTILAQMGKCYILDQQTGTGLNYFSELSRKYPDSGMVTFTKATLLMAAGEKQLAQRELQKVISNTKNSRNLRNHASELLKSWRKYEG